MNTHTAIANLEDRKRLAYEVKTDCEGMLCDTDGCDTFATYAVVPDGETIAEDVVCDRHHDTDANGFHVAIEPLSPDVAALHALLRR